MNYIVITCMAPPLQLSMNITFPKRTAGFRPEREGVKKRVISGLNLNAILWKRVDIDLEQKEE